jgi:hypothetical protein
MTPLPSPHQLPDMTLRKPHLAADVSLSVVADALSEWSWLLGDRWTAWLLSAVGDVFLINPAGEIARLDTGIAGLEIVAPTLEAFETAIADPDILADWFLERWSTNCGSKDSHSRPDNVMALPSCRSSKMAVMVPRIAFR